ncbi:MAG TPA: dTMP kinase [Roseiflexaceae bacterium]|nr:dTMP kinase [Roseiflexaceae bacterium]
MSLFITFEGPEGSGKSTQARLLFDALQERGYPVILVREPGGTRISDLIRRIVLDLQHTEMSPVTEILLFSAARAQLVNEKIRPYLSHGGIVLCDRYADSTYAYQGYGLGRPMDELRRVTEMATGGLEPDVTIYLDLSAEEGLDRKRIKRFGTRHERFAGLGAEPVEVPAATLEDWNRLDARELAFHQRVEAGYRALIDQSPARWRLFDARLPIDSLADAIRVSLGPLLAGIRPLEQEPL